MNTYRALVRFLFYFLIPLLPAFRVSFLLDMNLSTQSIFREKGKICFSLEEVLYFSITVK